MHISAEVTLKMFDNEMNAHTAADTIQTQIITKLESQTRMTHKTNSDKQVTCKKKENYIHAHTHVMQKNCLHVLREQFLECLCYRCGSR